MTNATLADALHLAAQAHEGQTDKAGLPYLTHILRMVERALSRGLSQDVAIVAALHDVVEDTEVNVLGLILSGFSPTVCEAVDGLTRRKGEPYLEFIARCKDSGEIARTVKLLDIEDNRSEYRLSRLDTATYRRLVQKYDSARAILESR